jgi:hypothetical protein
LSHSARGGNPETLYERGTRGKAHASRKTAIATIRTPPPMIISVVIGGVIGGAPVEVEPFRPPRVAR